MSTWSYILAKSAALLNNQDRDVYTDEVLLAYLNIAISELQEIFELHDIPSTHQTSAVINVAAGVTRVAYSGTVPQLPPDLVEINELWESLEGQETWTPVSKKNSLTGFINPNNATVANFGVWAWIGDEIHLLPSSQDNDLKIDYIRDIFNEITIGMVGQDNPVKKTDTFFIFRVAGLAAEFIDENLTRAEKLNATASSRLSISLGISIKGQQSIPVRRRPFRSSLKRRRYLA